jgi:DNA-binding HxlR family transcriptional regulator
MKKLNTELAKIILHELSRQPLGRTELEKCTVQKSGITHAVFESTFKHLSHDDYVKKDSTNYRAKYVLTKKGMAMLNVLREPNHRE